MKTNKEYLIEQIQSKTKLSIGAVTDLFEIIDNYNWKVFESQMGDYDHPEERISAKKVLDEKLQCYREEEWKKVWNLLNGNSETALFYDDNFHKMDEEFKS